MYSKYLKEQQYKKYKNHQYYAVKVGRHPGIYDTWEECYKEVAGYTNAVYKKFATLEEAVEFLKPKTKKIISHRIPKSELKND